MSKEEQLVVYYLNYARIYPADFARQAVEPYLKHNPSLRKSYGSGLLRQLYSMNGLKPCVPVAGLGRIARAHARDLALHNLMSHNSSDGTPFSQRLRKAGLGCGAESIHAGSASSPLEAVVSLLIDYKVPGLGHRKNLLNPANTILGVGYYQHKKGMRFVVIDQRCD